MQFKTGAIVLGIAAAATSGCNGQEQYRLSLLRGQSPGAMTLANNGSILPYRPGKSCYGWSLQLDPGERPVELEELFELPAVPPSWRTGSDIRVNPDRKSARSHIIAEARASHAQHIWCVNEGDPQGLYRFKIYRAGQMIGSLEFSLAARGSPKHSSGRFGQPAR